MVWAVCRDRFPARNQPAVLNPKPVRLLNSCAETAITLPLFVIGRLDPALEAAVSRSPPGAPTIQPPRTTSPHSVLSNRSSAGSLQEAHTARLALSQTMALSLVRMRA
jgi:hypothetical protein